jgi:hypothetical protein
MWKLILGYPNYAIDEEGNVKRLTSNTSGKAGHILKPTLDPDGYKCVSLFSDKRRTHYNHRLVAYAFLGPKPKGHQVNHIDGNKLNCHVTNLEYVTPAENSHHAARLNLIPFGECSPHCTISKEDVLRMRQLYQQGMRFVDIAKEFGRARQVVRLIIIGRTRHREYGHFIPADKGASAPKASEQRATA